LGLFGQVLHQLPHRCGGGHGVREG
jgi:hypothetical protein